jgi:hypothetical protein
MVLGVASPPSLRSRIEDGRSRIKKHDFFCGENREGGIVGDIDVQTGGITNGQEHDLPEQVARRTRAWASMPKAA